MFSSQKYKNCTLLTFLMITSSLLKVPAALFFNMRFLALARSFLCLSRTACPYPLSCLDLSPDCQMPPSTFFKSSLLCFSMTIIFLSCSSWASISLVSVSSFSEAFLVLFSVFFIFKFQYLNLIGIRYFIWKRLICKSRIKCWGIFWNLEWIGLETKL